MDEFAFTAKPPLREQFFDALLYKPKLLERKKVYERLLVKFEELIETFEDHTGLIGEINSTQSEYDVSTLVSLSHKVGDQVIYFADEAQRSRKAHPLATFNLCIDLPYKKELSSLQQYELSNHLLAHGVVSDSILNQYLSIISRLNSILQDCELPLIQSENDEKGLFWSLSEAREGSTVLELMLQYWDNAVLTGGGIGAFLAAYPKMSDGFKRLKEDISNFRSPKQPENVPSMIITENIEQELKKIKEDNS